MTVIEVHGLFVEDALKKIKDVIKENKAEKLFEVNHGYVHGNKIKVAIKERGKSLSNRISTIIDHPANSGKTLIYMKWATFVVFFFFLANKKAA